MSTQLPAPTAFRLTISVQPRLGTARIAVAGDVDSSTAHHLRDAIASLVEQVHTVEIDASGVTFLDSTGLRALLAGQDDLNSHACRLEIVAAPGQVRRTIALAGLSDLLRVDGSPHRGGPDG